MSGIIYVLIVGEALLHALLKYLSLSWASHERDTNPVPAVSFEPVSHFARRVRPLPIATRAADTSLAENTAKRRLS